MRRTETLRATALTLALAVGGCGAGEAAKGALVTTGFATTVPEPKPFIVESRPEELKFRPVGVSPAAREAKPRDKAGVANLRAELEAEGAALRQSAGLPPAAK